MHFPMTFRSGLAVAVLVPAFGLSGCGRGERAITEVRNLPERERRVHLDASSAERFGQGGHSHGEAAPATSAGSPFRWDMPEGWQEIAPTSMRVANFRFGDDGAGECYLTALPGSGGGAVANINRWRGQMGLEPWTEDDIAALPTTMFLTQDAPFVSVDGVFSGMGSAPKEGYRLLGTLLSSEQFTLFVKMIGPADVVKKEEENFKLFCSSLRIVSHGGASQ
jgi:hypothetical protein